ncbi:hypothetical protein HK097_008766 [Rhizophlyctis rosea]|uniref:Protein FRA10AC1 n=1 Tax=Rhizophlyctis rosea TaxID=64517 RepID=A0AAD5SBH4_9FUNG|nr:hypothetical protein HK097_008766 [Rhizophlyctis rosea]
MGTDLKLSRFLRTEEDDADTSWEARIAKKYYDKLFKEYCIADLSRYKEGKVAMRWRTQKEVVEGRGQFTCGSIHCTSSQTLRSWEVKFAYLENGERKNALVKLRLCPECSYKLNYRKIKEQEAHEKEAKRRKKRKEKSRKKRRKDEYEEDDVNIHREGDGEDDRRRKGKGRRHNEAGSGSESESEQEGDEEQKAGDGQSEASRIWGAPLPEAEPEKSRAEELDDYFEGLFQ